MPWTAIATGATGLLDGVTSILNTNKQAKVAKQNAKLEADTNKWVTERNIEASKRLAEYQNSWNLAQWNRENQYNSPVNQAKLYEEAGINKQAILGNINSNAASTPAAAGVMPDFSRGNGGAKKVAYQLPMIGEMLRNALSIYSAIEDVRGKRINNDIRDIDLSFAYGDRKIRDLLNHQTYYRNGGEYTKSDTEAFKRSLLYRAEMAKYDRDFASAKLADYYSYNRPLLKHQLQGVIKANKKLDNDLLEFNRTRRPLLDTFGVGTIGVDAAAAGVSNLIGGFGSIMKKIAMTMFK